MVFNRHLICLDEKAQVIRRLEAMVAFLTSKASKLIQGLTSPLMQLYRGENVGLLRG